MIRLATFALLGHLLWSPLPSWGVEDAQTKDAAVLGREWKLLAPQQAAYANAKSLTDAIGILHRELAAKGMAEYVPLCVEARIKRSVELTIRENEYRFRQNLYRLVDRMDNPALFHDELPPEDETHAALGEPFRANVDAARHFKETVKPEFEKVAGGGWPARTFFVFTVDAKSSAFYVDLQLDMRGRDPELTGYRPDLGYWPYASPVVQVSYGPSPGGALNYHPWVWKNDQVAVNRRLR